MTQRRSARPDGSTCFILLHRVLALIFAAEQIVLDIIDVVCETLLQAENRAAKESARLASRALLSLKRARSPQAKNQITELSAIDCAPKGKRARSARKTVDLGIIHAAVSWINTNRSPSQYRDWYSLLVAYWMSGKESKFSGQPVPLYNTVYQWLQRFANDKLNEPQENHGAKVTMDPNPMQRSHKKTASSDVLSGLRCALEAALKHVLKYLNEKNQHRTIILLSSISQNIWSLAQADVHYRQAANMRPGGDKDLDALVRMLDYSFEGVADPGPSLPQLELSCAETSVMRIKFGALDKEMLRTVNSVESRRFLNKHCDGLKLVGMGTFGAVFILMKGLKSTGIAMKIFHRPTSLAGAAKEGGKDAGALYYSKLLQKAKGAARVRSDIAPFAPVTVSMGGPSGLIFFPDVQHKPHGYTALFMQEAEGTFTEEVKGLSMLFQQKEGKVDGHAFILLAVVMKSVLGAVQTMHATGMTHRDIKPDNIMMTTNLDQGGFVHRLMITGKKAVAILIDFGLAAFPGVHFS